jgi:hypothetical protein
MDNKNEKLKQIIKDLREDNKKMKQELKELKSKHKSPNKPPTFRSKLYVCSSDLYAFFEKHMNTKIRRTEIDPLTGFEKTRTFQYMDILTIIIDYLKIKHKNENEEGPLFKLPCKYDSELYSLMKIDAHEKFTYGNKTYVFKKLQENGHIIEVEYF